MVPPQANALSTILDRRVIFVTGKGGVGKSTVCASLALAAADRGRRVVVCEIGDQVKVPRLLGSDKTVAAGAELELGGGIWATAIDPQAALREWLGMQLGSRALVSALTRSGAFQYFVAAAPGARELVTMTKAWELSQDDRWRKGAGGFDTVVIDAPASGHGIALIKTPRTFGDIAKVGPIRKQTDRVWATLSDPAQFALLAVTTPAEMPVTETLELGGRLRAEVGLSLTAIVCNAVLPSRFSVDDAARCEIAAGNGLPPEAQAALRAARSERARARGQHAQLARLKRGADAPVLTLPFLPVTELGRAELEHLAGRVAAKL